MRLRYLVGWVMLAVAIGAASCGDGRKRPPPGDASVDDSGTSDAAPDGGSPIDEGWCPSCGVDPGFVVRPDEEFRVHPTHPRIYFRDRDLPWLRARPTAGLEDAWRRLLSNAEWVMEGDLEPESPEMTSNVHSRNGWCGEAVAFVAAVTGEEPYLGWALRWVRALAAVELDPEDEGNLRERLFRMAELYDWLYGSMSSDDRSTVRDALVAHIDALWAYRYIAEPGYIGGHSRWGYGALCTGALAVHGEWERADELVAQCREHVTRGYYPAQAWIAENGGYQMGWAYTSSYTNFNAPYYVWTVGTNDVLLGEWMADIADYYLYGLQGDGKLPAAADAYSVWPYLGAGNVVYAQGVWKRPQAAHYYGASVPSDVGPLFEMLLWDPDVAPEPPSSLPPGHLFRNAGVVIARDRWDEETTHFVFRSASFYSRNHHHRDENSFTIHHRAPLAIDSGFYDAYETDHFLSYFTRTVAHNAVVVFQPGQEYTYAGVGLVANDGGQTFRDEPITLADVQPGGHASLTGIVRFEDGPALTYAAADATPAYDAAHVARAWREVAYLRRTGRSHPAIVVFDRVGATTGDHEIRFLLHTVNEPVVGGRRIVAASGGGRLTSVTVQPPEATIRVVGGAGHEFEVDGANHPYAAGADPEAAGIEPGAWRVEVALDGGGGAEPFSTELLHVLFVDDEGAPPVDADAVTSLSCSGCAGTTVEDWAVVFGTGRVGLAVEYAAPAGGISHHAVAGQTPGGDVVLELDGVEAGVGTAGPGGVAVFDVPAPEGRVVRVRPWP